MQKITCLPDIPTMVCYLDPDGKPLDRRLVRELGWQRMNAWLGRRTSASKGSAPFRRGPGDSLCGLSGSAIGPARGGWPWYKHREVEWSSWSCIHVRKKTRRPGD